MHAYMRYLYHNLYTTYNPIQHKRNIVRTIKTKSCSWGDQYNGVCGGTTTFLRIERIAATVPDFVTSFHGIEILGQCFETAKNQLIVELGS